MISSKNYVLCFGETLWDIYPNEKLPGGAPMNVALQLQKLNFPSAFISRIGKDILGAELFEYISQNIKPLYIQTDSIYSTGQVKVNATNPLEVTYDIIQPAAWDYISWDEKFPQILEKTHALAYGSLVCRNSVSRETLFKLLVYSKLSIFDVNLRTPHYEQKIIERLMKHANIAKFNEEELNTISEWYYHDFKDENEKMYFLQEKFSIESILVTKGAKGALFLNSTSLYYQPAFNVKTVDTVGSGDAFLAAMIKGILESKSPQENLRYACLIGAFIASKKGANHSISTNELEKIIQSNTVK